MSRGADITVRLGGSGIGGIPTKRDMQKNIDVLQKLVKLHPAPGDMMPLMDTIGILEAIQEKLP